MHQQHALALEDGQVRFRQQRQAGGLGKGGAHQEVAVAGDPVERHAARAEAAQRRRDGGVERVAEVVVAGPVFEDVAEQVEGVGVDRALVQEAEKGVEGARMRCLQVQVGDEERKRARGSGHKRNGLSTRDEARIEEAMALLRRSAMSIPVQAR
jgi:hypothetical protein